MIFTNTYVRYNVCIHFIGCLFSTTSDSDSDSDSDPDFNINREQ
jgi:hypothetical protein